MVSVVGSIKLEVLRKVLRQRWSDDVESKTVRMASFRLRQEIEIRPSLESSGRMRS